MKIAYISGAVIPSRFANSVHVMKMCQAFAKNGHSIMLFAPDRKDLSVSGAVKDVFDFYGVEKNFIIVKMPWLKIPGRGYYYGLKAAIEAKKRGCRLVYGRYLPGCFFSTLLNLNVIYEAHQPAIDSGKISSLLFARMIKKKTFQHLVVISNALKNNYLSKHRLSDEDIIIAHDGADPVFDPNGSALELDQIDKDSINVGYVGHLHSGRGIDLILKIAKRCPWALFHVIGGNENDISYWKTKAQKNVLFHGYMPYPKAELFRLTVDILLAPYQKSVMLYDGKSDTTAWMSPLKLFEYMAAGKPFICSNLPVIREVIEHRVNALLCDPEDLECWVESLELLKKDEELRNRLGSTAQKMFMNNYTWENRANYVLKWFKKA